jgi:primosomal protein N'
MSHNIDSIKISCLLYLDRPMQADLSDFLSDLTPSRKGEVLREILENGWQKYKNENGVGLDPEDFAQLIIENNNKKKERKKNKPKPKTTARKAKVFDKEEEKTPKTPVAKESGKKVEEKPEPEKDVQKPSSDNVAQSTKSTLSGMRSFSIEDLEDDDDEDVVDPLAKMKMKSS